MNFRVKRETLVENNVSLKIRNTGGGGGYKGNKRSTGQYGGDGGRGDRVVGKYVPNFVNFLFFYMTSKKKHKHFLELSLLITNRTRYTRWYRAQKIKKKNFN